MSNNLIESILNFFSESSKILIDDLNELKKGTILIEFIYESINKDINILNIYNLSNLEIWKNIYSEINNIKITNKFKVVETNWDYNEIFNDSENIIKVILEIFQIIYLYKKEFFLKKISDIKIEYQDIILEIIETFLNEENINKIDTIYDKEKHLISKIDELENINDQFITEINNYKNEIKLIKNQNNELQIKYSDLNKQIIILKEEKEKYFDDKNYSIKINNENLNNDDNDIKLLKSDNDSLKLELIQYRVI